MFAVTSAAASLAGAPGCAFIFSEGPPPPARQAAVTYFDCSDSYAAPIADTVLASLTALSAVGTYSDRTRPDRGSIAAVDAGFTAAFVASTIYGYRSVAACHEAKAARIDRMQRERLLPFPYGLAPWGLPPPVWPPPPPYRPAAVAPATPTPPTPR